MEQLTFKAEQFEGPLDLLLHLIQKHKLNICDIEISSLLTQYLAYMAEAREQDVDLTSEFIEMAARLIYIKTAMLLPRNDEGEELRRELSGTLIEYQLCRDMAARLADMYSFERRFVREPQAVESDNTYNRRHDALELVANYKAAVGKSERRLPPPIATFRGIVAQRVVSIGSRVVYILRTLYRRTSMPYDELYSRCADRPELIATFLALLELVRANRIAVDGGDVTFLSKR